MSTQYPNLKQEFEGVSKCYNLTEIFNKTYIDLASPSNKLSEDFNHWSFDEGYMEFLCKFDLFRGFPFDIDKQQFLAESIDPRRCLYFDNRDMFWNKDNGSSGEADSMTFYMDFLTGQFEKYEDFTYDEIASEEELKRLILNGSNAYWRQSIKLSSKYQPMLYSKLKKLGYEDPSIVLALPQPLPVSLFETSFVEKQLNANELYVSFAMQSIDLAQMLKRNDDGFNDKYYLIDKDSFHSYIDSGIYNSRYLRISLIDIKTYLISLHLEFNENGFIIKERSINRLATNPGVEVFNKLLRKNGYLEAPEEHFDLDYYHSLDSNAAQKYMFGFSIRKRLRENLQNGPGIIPLMRGAYPELDPDSKYNQLEKRLQKMADNLDPNDDYSKINLNSIVFYDENTKKIISNGFSKINKNYFNSISLFRPEPILEY